MDLTQILPGIHDSLYPGSEIIINLHLRQSLPWMYNCLLDQ